MGGLAAFASVALLTTGFAVWVVGVSNQAASDDLKVNVDTAANKSISFEMKITGEKKIKLAESKTTATANVDSNKIVHIDDASTENYLDAPLTVNISYTISYGKAYTKDFSKIHFEIINNPEDKASVTYCSSVVDAKNIKLGHDETNTATFKRDSEKDLTYIDAPVDIDLSKVEFKTDSRNNYTYTGTNAITFKWGSFFGKDAASPATFYNAKVGTTDSLTKTTKDVLAAEITEELDAMYQQMNDKTIQLRATLAK
jgi:hypothetical protein